MTKLTTKQFVDKWKDIELKEITSAHSHFIDICNLVGHPSPTDCDHKGEFFTFEIVTDKMGGGKGRADAWYKAKFIWEYKRPHWSLDKAYDQLLLYRESLGNPPLLITSDTHEIIIHTNFTNTAKKIYKIDFDCLLTGEGVELLKRAFYDPQSYEPDQTKEQVTKATANTFVKVATTLQKWARTEGRKENPEQLAHFIIRLLFSLFAEDMNLLPDNVFRQLVRYKDADLAHFTNALRNLFAAMRDGGFYGIYKIPHFDGGLFDDDFVPDLPSDILYTLRDACLQDWSSIDPSIFGTLFERIIDESKRSLLGLHYTCEDDIMLVVEPVLMQPLRHQWLLVKQQTRELLEREQSQEAQAQLSKFALQIATIKVLDPACGSGNFLYVSLQQLLSLQKEVIAFAGQYGLPDIPLAVSPAQLYGIETNPYAHELAQTTVWIGYIQWRYENGFSNINEPILAPLRNIQHKDAILYYDNGRPSEPDWPETDVIIGNPPFLGDRRMRRVLGHKYVEDLRNLYKGRLPGMNDLVCYWFEKARQMIYENKTRRAGLLATQAIRGGFNRHVLERIKQSGDIFMAWSDRQWVLDGAAVQVSMIGFDDGSETNRILDGRPVKAIYSNLRSDIDLTKAKRLPENKSIAFHGIVKSGPFDLNQTKAKAIIATGNSTPLSNSEVVKPWVSALDVLHRPRNMWIIDFGVHTTLEEAQKYEKALEYVYLNVKPIRDKVRRKQYREHWWLLAEPCAGMRKAIAELERFIVTPKTAKYRLFIWLSHPALPDQSLYVIARSDDYTFGILHSSVHEIWVRRKGTQLREAESGSRYSPTETFETFPFPWPLGDEPKENEYVKLVGEQAKKLVAFRQKWLNPDEVYSGEKTLKKRTLTNLYNALEYYQTNFKGMYRDIKKWERDTNKIVSLEEIEELDYIHNALNSAVLQSYGWDTLTDEEVLERLLTLNLERVKTQTK
jgi:hypothetical protein